MTTKHKQLKKVVTKEYREGEEKRTLIVEVCLGGSMSNNCDHFSITGVLYEGEKKINSNIISCGAIGKEIAKVMPELKIFEKLHLCDSYGYPMHFMENMRYHIEQGKEKALQYYEITQGEMDELKKYVSDKNAFEYHAVQLGIHKRYQELASEALKKLEEMTGDKYTHRGENKYSDKRVDDINSVDASFYTVEQIEQRRIEKINKKNSEEIQKKKEYREKQKEEARKAIEFEDLAIKWMMERNIDISRYHIYGKTERVSAHYNGSEEIAEACKEYINSV